MKKQILLLAVCLLSTTFLFAKKAQVEGDSYTDETSVQKVKVNKTDKEKKQNNFFSFFNSNAKYVYGEEFTLFTRNAANQLSQTKATVTVSTKTGKFGFGSQYIAAYYIVLMDDAARDSLNKAYENYLSDFENKKLDRKNKKSKEAYGKIPVTLNWGTIKNSTPNNGKVKAEVGYIFFKNSPYFTITIPETFNDFSNTSSAAARSSMAVSYSFTKSQLADLINNLSDAELMKIRPDADLEEFSDEDFGDSYESNEPEEEYDINVEEETSEISAESENITSDLNSENLEEEPIVESDISIISE